jgi:hypothetical protein
MVVVKVPRSWVERVAELFTHMPPAWSVSYPPPPDDPEPVPPMGHPYRDPDLTVDARELAELRAEVDALERSLRRTQRLLRRARWWAQVGFVLAAASWVTEAAILVAVRGWP